MSDLDDRASGRDIVARRFMEPIGLAAMAVFGLALTVYLLTLLPGPSVGDWGEMQWLPARLGIPHPTGYPLYVLLGKAFSLIPIGSLAFRAELFSAAAAAAAAGTAVLIMGRLRVRPVVAFAVGLALAATGELWLEATFPEMNGLHLLLMAALLHRAVVWRAERRDRDLLIGAALCGLSLANHALAATVIPFVIVFVLVDARDRLRERPGLLVRAGALFLVGLTPYLFIPIRALFGPPELYSRFLTWDGFSSLISGADLRSQMHFTLADGAARAVADVPSVVAQLQARSNLLFVAGGLLGGAIHVVRDRALGSLLIVLVAVNLYVFANYVGDLDHYLLITWLIVAIWLAIALEAAVAWLERHPGRSLASVGAAATLVLPLALVVGNWSAYDQSGNHDGERFADAVFANLPANAVLLTYWDALTTLGYEHCVDGRRPDVAFRALDPGARVTCDDLPDRLEDVARDRPVFALFAVDSELDAVRGSFRLVPGPQLAVPYGKRGLDHSGTLYRLVPRNG
ncbi:MAG: protein O-mannosyl-transferase family [Chloroflexota bacterium]